VNAWTTWQPHITAARLNSKRFRPRGSFTWTSEGFTVTSHILAVRRQSRVVWTGTAQGITGTHEWLFRDTPHGTRVTTTESFSGAPVEADGNGMQSILDASLPYWLKQLKTRAELSA
jgi:Activator of Hsp90 ATPase homolog 1-like protein